MKNDHLQKMCGIFRLTLLGFFFETIVVAQFNLQPNDEFEFDCLDFHVDERHFRGARFKFPIYEKIRYCRRPIDGRREVSTGENLSSSFSFETLRKLNVTPEEMLRWSSPIDQVEKYSIFLLDSQRFALETFFNCSSPWFGHRCEYSFDLGENLSFSNVVETTFEEKKLVNITDQILTNFTCFQLLKCDRGAPICLDWREICNGRIDCRNEGVDEEHCWQLELNECEPNEFRCHNGICIPKDFLNDDQNNADCLDRTDELLSYNQFDSCFQDATFRCEEQMCHPTEGTFPCGDGQCEKLLFACKNRRNRLLEMSILHRGNLSENCSMILSCLTKISGTSCPNSSYVDYLRQCESIFEFPIHPVVSSHIRFFYFNNRTSIDSTEVFFPDFICYDSFLCDTIQPSFIYKNITCRRLSTILNGSTSQYSTLVQNVSLFFQTCSSTYKKLDVLPKTIYRCKRSLKFISNHRLLDFSRDCPFGDDETFENTCGLNDSFRVRCNRKDNRCFSPIISSSICKDRPKDNFTQILFHEFCDGVSHSLVQQINEFNHTDENDCEHWPCSNIYTRCDDVKNCPNAEDEWNCIHSNCSAGFQPCISPVDYKLGCLPFSMVQDGKIDCLGASDEVQLCRTALTNTKTGYRYRYRCWESTGTQCTAASNLCNGAKQCSNRDDEKICSTPRQPCPKIPTGNRTTNDDILCQLFDREVERRMFFMLENVTGIRIKTENILPVPVLPEKQTRPADKLWPWRCNRGLYARYRNSTNDDSFRCFCPPSYYGELCQFQSERISLTLGILVADQYHFYTIVVRLLDETNTTLSSEQFPFMGIWGCYRSFNIYLLYPTRPKNLSKSYRLQIDAFDRSAMIYLASWQLQIPFLFLPVNRIASQLTIPVQQTSIIHSCPLKCLHGGQCRSYVNSLDVFCHCPSNWFGTHCQHPVNCSDCSSNSICIGSVGQRTLCLCPIDRAGPRCMIRVSCQPNSCLNNGRCVLIDDQVMNNNFICICREPFYGRRCESSKTALIVSLENENFVSYVLAYVVTISNESQPVTEVMMKKTLPDQSIVTFYLKEPFHLVFMKLNRHYYLATNTRIQCRSIDELITETEKSMPRIRLIKTYPRLCSRNIDLTCFFDGYYMCLCTSDRHANCFQFNQDVDLTCRHNDYCENDGSCYQDHRVCPSATICVCTDCYFGARCQYYAESLGVTLDDILRYEFRRHVSFFSTEFCCDSHGYYYSIDVWYRCYQ